ncbi:MAG: ATP-binding protein, partial [Oscillospiraceae bacterium]|nr:ATP-binding protein [Oscillospiraceae bacterium]
RERYPLRLVLSCSACLLAAFLFPVPPASIGSIVPYGTFMYSTLFGAAAASLFFCYRENGWGVLFCAISGYTVHHLASALNDLVQICFPHGAEVVVYLITLGAVIAVSYVVLSACIKKAGTIRIDNKKLLLLSALVLMVDVELGLIGMVFEMEGAPSNYMALLSFYNALSCVFVLCILFSLLANKHLELEVAVMSQLLEEEKKQYQMSRDNIEIINLKCHDLKHQIRQLRTDSARVDDKALREIEDAVGIYDSVARTGSDALDVILTEKSLICERAGIHLTCIADGEKIGFISPGDVYALFGNALDNAIEAVMQISDPERRSVSLNIQAHRRLLSIHVENYFGGTLAFEDDLPQTNKVDKHYHGFGMKSMRMIVERYDGYLTAEAQDQIFHLNIVMPIP